MNKRKQIRYMIVKDGCINVRYTDDFIMVMKDEYQYFFDTADYLFERFPDIRVFVKDESLFTEKPSIYYYLNDELETTFNGTVFFGKLGTYCVRSLSKKEVSFLIKNLKKRDDGTFYIRESF